MRTSETEMQHLLIAWIAISTAFAFVLSGSARHNPFSEIVVRYFIVSMFTVGIGFLFHELAHKVVAQRYGLWAEFRMSPTLLMLAVGVAYLAGWIFAAPGAVYISGSYITQEQNGRIAAAGPLMNILLAAIFIMISMQSGFVEGLGGYGGLAVYLGVKINLWLAGFNMLPFSVLDGKKVFSWSVPAFVGIYLLIILMW
ncbi:MAG TPA: site-2 protease family protein [Methanosarcinales archaeon]|nr:site-2 protease family protein [Methanosarcinales archaeon]